ncbi:DUF943 family protein [Pseudescherichia sp.]|uniref:DUF943 family protein n=1 Tax=Pseudescherichia sp. TaxID=2055881 RepID=UPI00289E701A|nr:DUF943 family protein [Pseudescherichia sp.]
MKRKHTEIIFLLLLFASVLTTYLIWISLRPVSIIAVHQDDDYSSVLVKNFPITEKGEIDWWFKNKDMLKSRYEIPKPSSYGSFTIIFWDYGDGYKEEGKYDRLCFYDMPPPKNCIDKNIVFYVSYSKNSGMYFITNNEKYYLKENGKIVRE